MIARQAQVTLPIHALPLQPIPETSPNRPYLIPKVAPIPATLIMRIKLFAAILVVIQPIPKIDVPKIRLYLRILIKFKMVKMAQGLFRQRQTVISQRQIF